MIKLEEIEYCRDKVYYHADANKVKTKRDDVIKQFCELSKTTKIPGYRPGKAPPHVVRMTYRKQIEDHLKKEMVSLAYDDIIFETKIKPIFYPKVQNITLDEGNFSCEMVFNTKPKFELGKYMDFEVKKPLLPSKEELFEQSIKKLCVTFGEVVPYGDNDFVEMGDNITIDFICDSKPELNKAGLLYSVGSSKLVNPEFDEGILGMSPGEERSIDLLEEPGKSDKKVNVKVKLHMGRKTIPCSVDVLHEKYNLSSLEKLKEKIMFEVDVSLSKDYFNSVSQQIVKHLIDGHNISIPKWLIDMEANSIASQNGLDLNLLDTDTLNMINDKAENQIKLSLILDSIKEREPETVFSHTELLNSLKQRAVDAGEDPEQFISEAEKNGQLLAIFAGMQHEAMLHWLVSKSKVVE